MANINTLSTKNKFGVPLTNGDTGTGILMPKLKYRFRVTLLGFGGATNDAKELTRNVVSCKRPSITHEEIAVHSYNSVVYVQGKHTWDPVELVVRDEITNEVTNLVGSQLQRQLNHFQQTTPYSSSDFKFDMHIEMLDGTNAGATEVWFLEGCFLKNVNYADHAYDGNEVVTITMEIRFDNATHYKGDNDSLGRVNGNVGDSPFPQVAPDLFINTTA